VNNFEIDLMLEIYSNNLSYDMLLMWPIITVLYIWVDIMTGANE